MFWNKKTEETTEEQFNYRKELEKRRDELTVMLKGAKLGSDDYNKYKAGIKDIDDILKDADDSDAKKKEAESKKKQSRWTAVKVIGGLGLGVAGLLFAHKDDISDSVPGKYLHGFVDKIVHWNLK